MLSAGAAGLRKSAYVVFEFCVLDGNGMLSLDMLHFCVTMTAYLHVSCMHAKLLLYYIS